MPAPRRESLRSGLVKNSPVPAYSVLGSLGSMARLATARLGSGSVSGFHVLPPSVVFQTPPPSVPAYIVLGSSGRITSARVRPPILPGPSACQFPTLATLASGRRPACNETDDRIGGPVGGTAIFAFC